MKNNPKPINKNIILIKKASGEEEPFEIEKLKRSLLNAGADNYTINSVITDIEKWIFSGATTKKIYDRAFSQLRRKKANSAIRYKLKQAIMELGPTGYPFEQLVGQIFEKQGYDVKVGQIMQGNCVTHEMDVIATHDHHQCLVECKYAIDQGKRVSVQVPLYVRSRIDDIIKKQNENPDYKNFSYSGWIVTNTRFTPDSIDFGECSGLKLLGWDYPENKGLKNLLEKEKIYPVTVLSQLTQKEKQFLLLNDIITCSQLLMNQNILEPFKLNKRKQRVLLDELNDICG